MALIIDAPMPKGKCWWEENGVEHECHLFPCWGNADNCPIIGEIPDSHGDLIDRKALSDAIGKMITDRDRMIGTYDTIEQIIDEAEAIVEATE